MKQIFKVAMILGILLVIIGENGCIAKASQTTEKQWTEEILDTMKIQEIDEALKELPSTMPFRFTDTVKQLIKGEIPFTKENFQKLVKNTFFSQIMETKGTASHILILILVAAVFTNFASVFEKSQVADISFYMMYLLLFIILMRAFQGLSQMALDTINRVLSFMKILLPSYFAAAVFASKSVSGWGFYELTLLMIVGIQSILKYLLIPAVNLYVLLSVVNNLMKEDYFSKMAELIFDFVEWTLKSLTASVIGIQTVQCLVLPVVDKMKTTVVNKTAGAIPGIGNIFSGVTEVALGSAFLVKNAIGAAGMIFLLLLCLIPLFKLGYCGVMYRLLAAISQPISDKRIVECINSVGKGAGLLLRILLTVGVLFFLSVALATATIV